MKKTAIYCCYIAPNITMEKYEEKVNEVMKQVRHRNEESIILGNINTKSVQWGSRKTDKRGEFWTEWMAELNLVVHND